MEDYIEVHFVEDTEPVTVSVISGDRTYNLKIYYGDTDSDTEPVIISINRPIDPFLPGPRRNLQDILLYLGPDRCEVILKVHPGAVHMVNLTIRRGANTLLQFS
jgi:hypothetical protein